MFICCSFVVPLGLPPLVLLLDAFRSEMVLLPCAISLFVAREAFLLADETSCASFGMDKLSNVPMAPPDRTESRVPSELLFTMIVLMGRG